MKVENPAVERAIAVYTRRNLALYDRWVLGFSNRRIWRCDTGHLLALYRDHLSSNHLEAGPGTGHLLAETIAAPLQRLALVDLSPLCLAHAAERLAAFHPETHLANLLEPFDLPGPRFESVAACYVIHCLPGRLDAKAGKIFDHLAAHLRDDGVLFGATILGKDIQRPLAARLLMAHYNRRGVFDNREDSLGGLMEALAHRFRTFNVEVRGCVVLFWGKGLRESYRNSRPPRPAGAAAV